MRCLRDSIRCALATVRTTHVRSVSEDMRTGLGLSFLVAVCAGSFAVPSQSKAQDLERLSERSTRLLDRCLIKADFYGREQNNCWFADMNRQTTLTKRAYRSAQKRAGAGGRRALAVSQRLWKRNIDRKCHTKELFGPSVLGTIEISDYLACLSIENMDRMDWLERQHRGPKPRRSTSR